MNRVESAAAMPPVPGLGRKLKAARTRANMTQEALARRARIGRVYLARIESGRYDPRSSIVVRLARALGVSTDDLLR